MEIYYFRIFKKKIFDYEVDSDDEWEDEPEGESIISNEDLEEEQVLGEEDEDDGFFVPHGHLSDDELDEDDRIVINKNTFFKNLFKIIFIFIFISKKA